VGLFSQARGRLFDWDAPPPPEDPTARAARDAVEAQQRREADAEATRIARAKAHAHFIEAQVRRAGAFFPSDFRGTPDDRPFGRFR